MFQMPIISHIFKASALRIIQKKMLCFLPLWGSHFRKKKKDISKTPKIHGDKEHHKNIYEVDTDEGTFNLNLGRRWKHWSEIPTKVK